MKKKIVSIFVMTLLIATVSVPVMGNTITKKNEEKNLISNDLCEFCFIKNVQYNQPDHVLPVGDCDDFAGSTEPTYPRTLLVNWIGENYHDITDIKECDEDTENRYWAHTFCLVEGGICPHTKIESAILEITVRNDDDNDHLKVGCLNSITDTWDFNKLLTDPPCSIPVGSAGTITIDLSTLPGLLDDLNGLGGNLDVAVDDDSPVDCAILYIECEECDPNVVIENTVQNPNSGQFVEHINAAPGDTATFKLEVCNNGNDNLAEIHGVKAYLPKCFDYELGSAYPSEDLYSDGPNEPYNTLRWNSLPNPIVSPGSLYEITFDVKINCVSEGTYSIGSRLDFHACEYTELDDSDDSQVTVEIGTAEPDLECTGTLSWTDEKPGTKLYSTIYISNKGEAESSLNWEVAEYPEWGKWSSNPSNGTNLKPEEGPVQCEVEVEAPEKPDKQYQGDVKIQNLNNPEDYEIIPVTLTTPKNKVNNYNFELLEFLENHPLINKIIQILLQI